MLTTQFSQILQDVKAVPYRNSNNENIGYQLHHLVKGSVFDKAGLKSGDVITEINGAQLGNISQDINYLNSFLQFLTPPHGFVVDSCIITDCFCDWS